MLDADYINRRAAQIRQQNAQADEKRRVAAAAATPREARSRQRDEERVAAPTRRERREARSRRRDERRREIAERTELACKITSYAIRNRIRADARIGPLLERAWIAGTYEVQEVDGDPPRTRPVYACGNGKFYVSLSYQQVEGLNWDAYKSLPDGMDEAIARLVARCQEPWD